MTYYISRDEYSASSEEYFSDQRSDSALFSPAADVDHWCHSAPGSSGFPLTPPDSASDCDPSEFGDMTSQPWPVPDDDWPHNFAPDASAWMQPPPECDWQTQKSPVANAESHVSLVSSDWLRTSYGTVDTGLSPALSHASQTSRTLSTYAHPDVSLLPQGLDLSFVSNVEPNWEAPLSNTSPELNVVHPEAYVGAIDAAGFPTVDGGVSAYPMYPTVSGSSVTTSSPQLSVYSAHGLNHQSRRKTTSDVPPVYQRPLLPRTNPHQTNPEPQPSSSQGRALKPRHMSAGLADTVDRRSDASGPVQVSTRPGPGYVHVPGPHSPHVQVIGSHPAPPGVASSPEIQYQARPLAPVSHPVHDSATLDIDHFIKFDQDDQPPVRAMRSESADECDREASTDMLDSYPQANIPAPAVHAERPSMNMQSTRAKRHSAASGWTQAGGLAANAATNNSADLDEGRHRNHPLYSKGPGADGMYRCPWEKDQNCQHKPAKLKCAYDKYVDSHLKPFRCKQEACAKQEFSSTACLLRHEREAHGMHGHGDRPHLCHYTGCERSQPGNGFPRKYNLYDHMKRVHDHKEEPVPHQMAYPDGELPGMRKGGGRKRKSQGAGVGEPAAQRPRQLSQGYDGQPFAPAQWSA